MHRHRLVLSVSCVAIWLGDLLHIVGLLTPYWQEFKHHKFQAHRGVFTKCVASGCFPVDDWRSTRACQAFMIVGAITGFLGGVIMLAYIITNLFTSRPFPPWTTFVAAYVSLASFVCRLIGIIIYAAVLRVPELTWSHSFGLCLAGTLVTGVGGVLIPVSLRIASRNALWAPEEG